MSDIRDFREKKTCDFLATQITTNIDWSLPCQAVFTLYCCGLLAIYYNNCTFM